MTHLFLFTIGPVQSFIAAARRTQDLYVGSRMLSMIARAGVLAAQDAKVEMLFPVTDASGELPLSVSHRFAFLSEHEPGELAKHIEDAMRSQWLDKFAAPVRKWLTDQIGSGDWHDAFNKQTANWLECYWVAVPYEDNKHGECFRAAGKALAARKQARSFPQVKEVGQKCTLTGAQSALPLNWDRLRKKVGEIELRENEALGAIALIKRFAQKADCDLGVSSERIQSFPSTDEIAGIDKKSKDSGGKELEGYIAILHMDGDSMGKLLSTVEDKARHQEITRALSAYATEVDKIIDGVERAVLVYAGGDDVLALVPLPSALKCANELRKKFAEVTGSVLTMSAGIAITPYNLPLDTGLEEARRAEDSAKDDYDRNAVAVHELHGSGQIRQSGAKWVTQSGKQFIDLIQEFEAHFKKDNLSGKYAYDLMQISQSMGGQVPAEARAAEAKRLLKRRTAEGKSVPVELATRLAAFGEDPGLGKEVHERWESLANWLILARFLAKGGQR